MNEVEEGARGKGAGEAQAGKRRKMGNGGKEEKMEDSGRKGEETAGVGGDIKAKDKETSPFSEGDKVLAYHGPLIYEAKILRAEFRKKEWKYFVHYLGWSKNWDEWVGTDRLMALTDTNLEIQKKLFKNQNVDKQSKGRLPQGRQKAPPDSKGEREGPKVINSVPKGKKRKAESTVSEEKDADEPEPAVKIPLPPVLKKQLVDDWDLIQAGKLIKLPKSPNVVDILKKYREFKIKRDSMCGHLVEEILNGIRSYFNKALPAMLLYKQERSQFARAVPDGAEPSLIYGAEHLLRLFVKLPELLGYANMEEHALQQLQQKLMDILKFLQKYQSSFFLSMYEISQVGVCSHSDEKKLKRESSNSNVNFLEEKKDRQDVNKAVEDRKEKREVSKSSDDRWEKKDSSKVMISERRDKRDGSRSADEKREKDLPKLIEKEKRNSSKSSEEKKVKTGVPVAPSD